MTTYKTIRETQHSNLIVRELNAAVCTATFPAKSGEFKADLYSNPNSSDCLVFHNTCPPVHGKFIETVTIVL